MNKKQQLYIKNEKGRYEPYKPKKPEPSDTLYKKVERKCFGDSDNLLDYKKCQESISFKD